MFLTEYDEERTLAFLKKESLEEGIEIGRERERKSASVEYVITIMHKLNMQVDEAADFLEIPKEKRPAIKAAVEEQLKEKV